MPKRDQPDKEILKQLARDVRGIGETLNAASAAAKPHARTGYALLLFRFDGPEFAYASNGKREDVVRMMKEFIDLAEASGKRKEEQNG